MNKKNIKILIIVLSLIIFIISVFYFTRNPSPPPLVRGDVDAQIEALPLSGESIKVSLIVKEKKYEAEVKYGSTVFDVMNKIKEENNLSHSFDFKYIEHTGLGIFINEINNKISGRDGYWIYSVNGVEASVGVSNYKIKDGDIISWKYEK